jgi:hypothetical protein
MYVVVKVKAKRQREAYTEFYICLIITIPVLNIEWLTYSLSLQPKNLTNATACHY